MVAPVGRQHEKYSMPPGLVKGSAWPSAARPWSASGSGGLETGFVPDCSRSFLVSFAAALRLIPAFARSSFSSNSSLSALGRLWLRLVIPRRLPVAPPAQPVPPRLNLINGMDSCECGGLPPLWTAQACLRFTPALLIRPPRFQAAASRRTPL